LHCRCSERWLSEGEGINAEVVHSNAENEEQEEQNNLLQLTDIKVYMEEALLDTPERLDRRYSEEADIKDDARNKTGFRRGGAYFRIRTGKGGRVF
jgi:hypothetical protein